MTIKWVDAKYLGNCLTQLGSWMVLMNGVIIIVSITDEKSKANNEEHNK